MPFDATKLSTQQLLERAHSISSGRIREAIEYLTELPQAAPSVRAAVAKALQFKERHPAASDYIVDRFGRLQVAQTIPAWATREAR